MANMSRRSVIADPWAWRQRARWHDPTSPMPRQRQPPSGLGRASFPQEDAALKKTVADYEKASGNKIEYSIMPFMALNQKTISALTSGDVPDLVFSRRTDGYPAA